VQNPPRLLFADDEPSIRVTLSAILKQRGFEVTVAATVPEALNLIAGQKFEVLISDLNIGEPGDGFTVVSAMRRTQPEAATFILTDIRRLDRRSKRSGNRWMTTSSNRPTFGALSTGFSKG
jgi:CheY-like chemotaxis protein